MIGNDDEKYQLQQLFCSRIPEARQGNHGLRALLIPSA
jgi:hypothetical protein